MKHVDRFALEDMLRYAEAATRLLGTIDSASALEADEKTLFAVWLAVQMVGEAASKVSEEMRAELQDIAWKTMIGMRHHLVHGYRTVQPGIIVQTIRQDFPPLVARLESALKEKKP